MLTDGDKRTLQMRLGMKAKAIVASIQQYNGKDKEQTPTVSFVQDYNLLRNKVLEIWPNELKDILPPEVKIINTQFGDVPDVRYIEIMAYAQQIVNLLV